MEEARGITLKLGGGNHIEAQMSGSKKQKRINGLAVQGPDQWPRGQGSEPAALQCGQQGLQPLGRLASSGALPPVLGGAVPHKLLQLRGCALNGGQAGRPRVAGRPHLCREAGRGQMRHSDAAKQVQPSAT